MEYTSALCEQITCPSLEDRTPLEWLTGETPNILEFTDFDFYQFVIWYNPNDSNEGGQVQHMLGRWLIPTKGCGQRLCYYILKENGMWTARLTVHPVTIKDYAKYPKLKDEMKQFNECFKEVIGVFDGSLVLQSEVNEPEEALFVLVTNDTIPTADGFEDDKVEGKDFDPLIHTEVILLHKGGNMMAEVLGWKHDTNGNLVGCRNHVPTMDSHVYEVEFLDGCMAMPTTSWLNIY